MLFFGVVLIPAACGKIRMAHLVGAVGYPIALLVISCLQP